MGRSNQSPVNAGIFAPPLPRIVGVASDVDTLRAVNAGDCDIVELRVDALSESELAQLPLVPCPVPVLLTYRDATEGGYKVVAQEERKATVRRLLPMAAAVDWEIALLADAEDLMQQAHTEGVALVASAHFFSRTPHRDELNALERTALSAGADVVKVAFTPRDMEQVKSAAEWLRHPGHPKPIALMGMGLLAEQSRTYLSQCGSALLYGYLGNRPTAPGQMSAARCRELRALFAFK